MDTNEGKDARGASLLHAELGADARRDIGKWLNEQPARALDRTSLAELCAGYDELRYLIDIAYDHLLNCGYREEDPTLTKLRPGLSEHGAVREEYAPNVPHNRPAEAEGRSEPTA